MSLIAVLQTALTKLNSRLTTPQNRPQTQVDLAGWLEEAILTSQPKGSARFYVPDVELPITVSEKDEHITGPVQYLEGELRSVSSTAKSQYTQFSSIVAEVTSLRTGLMAQLQKAAASITAIQQIVGSSSLQWMSISDTFLTTNQVDMTQSSSILIETQTGGGVLMQPASETNLNSSISQLSVLTSASAGGIPGDNMELASIQANTSADSPAAGSSSALATAQSVVGSSGGSGQEPIVSYVGNPDLFADLSKLISKSDWFDWERNFVPPTQSCTMMGTAYVSDSSGQNVNVVEVTDNYGWTATVENPDGSTSTTPLVQFEPNIPIQGVAGAVSNPLNLEIEIDMGQVLPLNQISIVARQLGGLWPSVTSVMASSDNNTWYPMTCQGSNSWQGNSASTLTSSTSTSATGNNVSGQSLWQVSSVDPTNPNATLSFRYVAIKFQQLYAYPCKIGIGHPYYVEVIQTNSSSSALFGLIHSSSSNTTVTRYASAGKIVNMAAGTVATQTSQNGGSIGTVLGDVATAGAAVEGAGSSSSTIGNLVTGFVNGLLGSSTTSTDILQTGEYNDVFASYRQVISLGGITVYAREFSTSTSSQLVTENFTFSQSFSAVRLLVDEVEPQGTSIAYEISTDNGTTWQNITECNIANPADAAISSTNVLQLSTPATTCRMRSTLSTTNSLYSPNLLGYTLEVLPA